MASTKTPLELAALATAAVPGLKVTELKDPQYDDDFASVSGVIDAEGNTWTVMASKEKFSSSEVATLSHFLNLLDGARMVASLPFSVPQLRGAVATEPGTYTFVYSDTGGRPLVESQVLIDGLLAASLGRSLAALHNLGVSEFIETGAPVVSAEKARTALQRTLGTSGLKIPSGLRRRWTVALDEDVLWSYQPTLIHGDLGLANVLADGGAVISLTGFKYLRVDDPAIDLAWLLSIADEAFIQRFQGTYSAHRKAPDLHLLTRAQLHSEIALLQWLQFGHETDDSQVVADANSMLTELDTDLGGALLVKSSRPVVEIHFEANDEPLHQVSSRTETSPSRAGHVDAPPDDKDLATGGTPLPKLSRTDAVTEILEADPKLVFPTVPPSEPSTDAATGDNVMVDAGNSSDAGTSDQDTTDSSLEQDDLNTVSFSP